MINKTLIILFFAEIFVIGFYSGHELGSTVTKDIESPDDTEVYFSPKGGCTARVVRAINEAQKTILIQAYSFTSKPIEEALLDAKKRGVEIKIILDRSQYDAKGSIVLPLYVAGIEIRMDAKHAIAHNKVMVIDSNETAPITISGSFNFTGQAETSNAENMEVFHRRVKANIFTANWNNHYAHSDPYNGEIKVKSH